MNVLSPEGLANHAESVSCYLYEYGRASSKALRNKYSKSFFTYLLAASWMKLYSRFCSWQALGFIMGLERAILDDGIASMVKEVGDPSSFHPFELPEELGPGDRSLADFFLQNKEYLLPMLADTCETLPTSLYSQLAEYANSSLSRSEGAIELTFNAFCEAASLALNREERKPLYTKKTALSFHCLLYLSFLMTGRALREIKDSHQALNGAKVGDGPNVCKYRTAIRAAELPVRLLIYVLSSTAFRLHMGVWSYDGIKLSTMQPHFRLKKAYKSFGTDRKIRASSKQALTIADSENPDYHDEDFDFESDLVEVREPIC